MHVEKISEVDFKSHPDKWRSFLYKFKEILPDYNVGALVRLNVHEDFSPENSTFGVRLQFYAVELARMKEGLIKPLTGDVEQSPRDSEHARRVNLLLNQQFKDDKKVNITSKTKLKKSAHSTFMTECANCNTNTTKDGKPLQRCSRCKGVYYCSRECQTSHWPKHKPNCTA